MKKNFFKIIVCSALSVVLALSPINIFAQSADLLYENKEIQTITSGVTYEKSTRLYKGGWMDVYVMTVDLQNPNVKLDVIESATEYGLKKSVENLAKENNVVAAVNGDFFSSGNPRSSMGQVVSDGKTKSAQDYYNSASNKYAGFFVDKTGVAFIDYMKSRIGFYTASGGLELQAKNKVTDFSKPVYFDRQAITTTADLDKRYSNLYKICVSNGVISKISWGGETVEVPTDGYIIVMNYNTAKSRIAEFSVGQSVSFVDGETFVFRPEKNVSELDMGISGGGEILRNGSIINQGLIIGQNSRNPRTCIGVSKDKTKAIIIAVDGRGSSIGATHTELGNLLLEYGAYDGIHFDGGGSTTVALKEEGSNSISVVNTPSEGSQRAVANALGIKSVGQSNGEVTSLNVLTQTETDGILFNGTGESFKVQGFDSNHNPVEVNQADVVYSNSGVDGTWEGNKFIPSGEGKATITAQLGNASGQTEVRVISGATSINAKALNSALSTGESTYLIVNQTNKDGFESEVSWNEVNWSVNNPSIGYVEGGKFYATGDGTATLTAEHNGVSATVSIVVGKVNKTIESFESPKDLYMMYYPTDKAITGGAGVTGAYQQDGSKSLMLSYKFEGNSTQTQAAYVCFERSPINITGDPTNIGMWVRGDKSGNLLKMVLKDANNNEYSVPIINALNSDQWEYAEATVPSGVAYPIRIDKIYVAALETTNAQSSQIFIDNISAKVPATALPNSTSNFKDYKNVTMNGSAPSSNEEDITIFGQTANKPSSVSESMLQRILSKMSVNAKSMLFVGSSNVNNTTGVNSVSWNNTYFTTNTNNFSIINLATQNGSIRKSSPDQWRWLQSYLNDFSKNNIIINMDKNIWDSNNDLSDNRENELLQTILSDFVLETGKNVLVVSASGTSTSSRVIGGVRYVNLNGLSSYTPENPSSYSYLRVRGDSDNMFYCFEGIQ